MKRVFLIVLDSLGAGSLPDAHLYGDEGAHTLKSISKSQKFNIPTLKKMGIGNIEGLEFLKTEDTPLCAYGRCEEKSAGKDTTTGHWEIAGLVLDKPFPTFPNGFGKDIIDAFCEKTGRGVLCNKPYSGTQVIEDFGEEHIKTGKLIVYTSADSVFQIAAHEGLIPREKLYEYCKIARELLQGENGVGRVIARPFTGEKGFFKRTDGRHDYSIPPFDETMNDKIKNVGKSVIAIGKINDIFAGKGITKAIPTKNNENGCDVLEEIIDTDFKGLCFVNLVDFDMIYGHRNDVDGYAQALSAFDLRLKNIIGKLREDDVLVLTADHGCDPAFAGTDHTREYIPLLVYGEKIKSIPLGTRRTYADIGKTICDWLSVPSVKFGESFKNDITERV